MKNYRATKSVYGLKEGTDILNEARGYYARIDCWSEASKFYYATELIIEDDGSTSEVGILRITPHDLVGCEIFER